MKRNTNYVPTDLTLNGKRGTAAIGKTLVSRMGAKVGDVLIFTVIRGELFICVRTKTPEDKHLLCPNTDINQSDIISLRMCDAKTIRQIFNNFAPKAHCARFRVGDCCNFGGIMYYEVITRKNYAEEYSDTRS